MRYKINFYSIFILFIIFKESYCQLGAITAFNTIFDFYKHVDEITQFFSKQETKQGELKIFFQNARSKNDFGQSGSVPRIEVYKYSEGGNEKIGADDKWWGDNPMMGMGEGKSRTVGLNQAPDLIALHAQNKDNMAFDYISITYNNNGGSDNSGYNLLITADMLQVCGQISKANYMACNNQNWIHINDKRTLENNYCFWFASGINNVPQQIWINTLEAHDSLIKGNFNSFCNAVKAYIH